MNVSELIARLSAGPAIHPDREENLEDSPWIAHPAFAGVQLKHLVRGLDTGGRLSCHLVRVEPGKSLLSHVHDGQWELHEVLSGEGHGALGGNQVPYRPGCQAVIPQGTPHAVTAGDQGLVLLAKFFPALV